MTNNLIALKTYCAEHDIDYKRARRLAKRGEFDGAVNLLGKYWAIAADAPVPTLPPNASRGTRSDGRQRYVVYATTAEIKNVAGIIGDANVIDPRNVARQRRIERKMKTK